MRLPLLLAPLALVACQQATPVAAPADLPAPINHIEPSPPPPSTPPPPVPPVPPDASWLLAQPEPVLTSTGDPKVDAYRDRLLGNDMMGFGWAPILKRLLAGIKADPAILAGYERMRAIDTPAEYVRFYVTPERIAAGRKLYRSIGQGAAFPSAPDGTPLELTIALWGALSDYGTRKPEYDLLQVLLVLGANDRVRLDTAFPLHDAAMLIVQRKVAREKLRGWDSGRMGDVQYSPDFYSRLGQDGDGDGFADIWDNRHDILANLKIPVREEPRSLVIAVKPETFDRNDPGQARIAEGLGSQRMVVTYFKRWDGKPWPADAIRWYGRYTEPFGKTGPAFLLMGAAEPVAYRDPYRDYYEGNVERGFVLAVGLLAEAIAGRPIPDLSKLS